jgi:hypothetical protein
VRVFKYDKFSRYADKENISDSTLLEAVRRAESGQVDADLGGGVIKQRIPRQGQGKRGGYRTLILYRAAERTFFIYGFGKNDRDNISDAELSDLKKLAAVMLVMPDEQLTQLINDGVYLEVL